MTKKQVKERLIELNRECLTSKGKHKFIPQKELDAMVKDCMKCSKREDCLKLN